MNDSSKQACILCLTEHDDSGLSTEVDLENNLKTCNCNPPIHNACAKNWYEKSGYKCPICLKAFVNNTRAVEISPVSREPIFVRVNNGGGHLIVRIVSGDARPPEPIYTCDVIPIMCSRYICYTVTAFSVIVLTLIISFGR